MGSHLRFSFSPRLLHSLGCRGQTLEQLIGGWGSWGHTFELGELAGGLGHTFARRFRRSVSTTRSAIFHSEVVGDWFGSAAVDFSVIAKLPRDPRRYGTTVTTGVRRRPLSPH